MTTIGIIDDDINLLENFSSYINSIENLNCVIKVSSFEGFQKHFKYEPEQHIDILFLDIRLNQVSALEILPKIKRKIPNADIIMYTVVEDANTLIKSFCLGATGYLVKERNFETLKNYIEIIQSGGAAVSPFMAKKLVSYFQPQKLRFELNDRESQILKLLAEGWSYKEVADNVGLTVDGTRYHIRNIYKKLSVNTQTELIRMYMEGKIDL